jgi:TDG/mug DNA glycosylase family protein
MGFSRQELESFRDATVPDLVVPPVKLLFVGINPGLWTAAVQTHFAYPGNRFYPALLMGGVIDWPIDPGAGMTDDDRERFTARGLGISNIVDRATAKASELSREELRIGADRLATNVARWKPTVVAIAGITAYRTGFRQPKAVMGRQPGRFGEAELWVVPNPSGLNAHETVTSLAAWYRRTAVAAGVIGE